MMFRPTPEAHVQNTFPYSKNHLVIYYYYLWVKSRSQINVLLTCKCNLSGLYDTCLALIMKVNPFSVIERPNLRQRNHFSVAKKQNMSRFCAEHVPPQSHACSVRVLVWGSCHISKNNSVVLWETKWRDENDASMVNQCLQQDGETQPDVLHRSKSWFNSLPPLVPAYPPPSVAAGNGTAKGTTERLHSFIKVLEDFYFKHVYGN